MDTLAVTALILAAIVLAPAALLIITSKVRTRKKARQATENAAAFLKAFNETTMKARSAAAEQLVRDINQGVMSQERARAHYANLIPHPDNQPIVTKGWMQP